MPHKIMEDVLHVLHAAFLRSLIDKLNSSLEKHIAGSGRVSGGHTKPCESRTAGRNEKIDTIQSGIARRGMEVSENNRAVPSQARF